MPRTQPTQCCVPPENNTKMSTNTSDVNQTLTQTQRAVNAIRYNRGGTIQYGNVGVPRIQVFLPPRNKF
jgi:hypothetical protein